MDDKEALRLAKAAYETSTTYVDANYRKQWEDGLRLFQGRHPQDSKYNSDAYKYRSRLFRPKTRAIIRRTEAVAAAAFFSNVDVVDVAAVNEAEPMQVASAGVVKALVNYRLQKTIPWFVTLIGAIQDAATVGVAVSYQYWKRKTKQREVGLQPVVDEFGQPMMDESGAMMAEPVVQEEILEDEPCIKLLPVENVRIDPAADWTDPVNSSPYVIILWPMYVMDVKGMMENPDMMGRTWRKLTDGQIRAAMKEEDTTRSTRERQREDSKDNGAVTDYEVVWVHENFVRKDGEDFVYYTLGTQELLTDPVPLEEVYFHGERPVVMGTCVLETHKTYPNSLATLGKDLQSAANEIQNSRLDNVKMVLNKRWLVKRGQEVDISSLQRNVAGSVTMVNDPNQDVRELNWPDVTSSAYQEQDRLNVDYDDLLGNFSGGTVQTNRSLNETVGGMQLLASGANVVTEYTLRLFVETWVEPVLRQLAKLEQAYESDEVILALAGQQAQIMKYGMDQVTDELIKGDLTVTVNVGMGATDPITKLNKFTQALMTYGQIAAMQRPEIDLAEVGKEVFGLAGYRDGARFLNQDIDPRTQMIAAQMAQDMLGKIAQQAGPQRPPEPAVV